MGRIHLGTIFGTTITLDFSFLILIVFFVMTDVQQVGMRYALLWVPVLLISILWHELAHAAMIGALGFGSSAIILEGIGGATYNERRAKPWQDLLISAAGPASSFLLAWIIALLIANVPAPRAIRSSSPCCRCWRAPTGGGASSTSCRSDRSTATASSATSSGSFCASGRRSSSPSGFRWSSALGVFILSLIGAAVLHRPARGLVRLDELDAVAVLPLAQPHRLTTTGRKLA